jgi:hypothetical protein
VVTHRELWLLRIAPAASCCVPDDVSTEWYCATPFHRQVYGIGLSIQVAASVSARRRACVIPGPKTALLTVCGPRSVRVRPVRARKETLWPRDARSLPERRLTHLPR